MWLLILVRYLHFVGIFLVVGGLFAELVLVKKVMKRGELARIARIDGVYGIGAIIAVTAGLIMWLGVGKSAEFYSGNWIFWMKIGLFSLVGILSIWPTVFFIKQRKGNMEDEVSIPSLLLLLIRIEMGIVLILPLLAALMAKGITGF